MNAEMEQVARDAGVDAFGERCQCECHRNPHMCHIAACCQPYVPAQQAPAEGDAVKFGNDAVHCERCNAWYLPSHPDCATPQAPQPVADATIGQQAVDDAALIDWLESNHTLHRSVEITYVVDGYMVEITNDDSPIGEPIRGESLRAALTAALAAHGKGG